MEFTEVLEEVRKENVSTQTMPASNIKLLDEVMIKVEDQEYIIKEANRINLCKFLSLPSPYIEGKCPTSLRNDNLNYWLSAYGEDVQVCHTNDTFIGLLKPNVPFVPFYPVLEEISKVVENPSICNYKTWGNYSHNIELSTPEKHEIKVGDFVKGGLSIRFSPFPDEPREISAYLTRLVCSNGMRIAEHGKRMRFSGKGLSEILSGIRENVKGALQSLAERVGILTHMANTNVDDKEHMIHRMFAEFGLPAKMYNMVMEAAAGEEDTMWGVVNAFTAAANNVASIHERIRLQSVAGDFVAQHKDRCPQCLSIIDN